MPIYKAQISKRAGDLGSEEWLNSYWLERFDVGAAMSDAQVIMAAEIAFHAETTTFTKILVKPLSGPEQSQVFLPVNVMGERTVTDQAVPLWNVVRADFADGENARPERKYYRLAAQGSEMHGQLWDGALVELVQTTLDTLIAGGSAPQSPTGGEILAVFVKNEVQMRQLHWSRKFRPGFHRGYIPNV